MGNAFWAFLVRRRRPSAVLALTLDCFSQFGLEWANSRKNSPSRAITRQLRRDFERDIQTGEQRERGKEGGGNAPRGPNASDNLGEDEDETENERKRETERERAVNVLLPDGNDLPSPSSRFCTIPYKF